ncbi:MAG: hypothetical protein KZQ88_16115 [Candidatus Thiodiazotropha sp. (ex Dulcina madagascariensis)]|nr:hypothetical protein [Candidatus Thiodiazotropha sp. (ex Dulcina madagascariensis)]MCU7926962.1 hypothetical protein [Candidatus Thiodiazotropha sp. (ex Dulcina madagascariensis)]
MINKTPATSRCHSSLFLLLLLMLFSMPSGAEEAVVDKGEKERNTLATLLNLVSIRGNLEQDIEALNRKIAAADSEARKQSLSQALAKLNADLANTEKNFVNISAGVDLSVLQGKDETKFDFQQELFALLKPAIDEMKDMTSRVR